MSIRKEGHINPIADQKAVRAEVVKEMNRIGLLAERLMLDYLSKHNIDYNGDLAKSITSEVNNELTQIRLQFGANVKHAIFVHDGTKPHWAPIKPLRQWVFKKLGITFPEADRVAHAIQKKIAKQGTKAKPFAEVTMRLLQAKAPKMIEAAIDRGVSYAS